MAGLCMSPPLALIERMSGKTSAQRRAQRGVLIEVFSSNSTLGLRHIGWMEVSEAAEKLVCGDYREVQDASRNALGIQPVKAQETIKRPSGPSPASISLGEMKRIAGEEGESATVHLSKAQHRAVPEDAIERAIRKLQQWPFPASRIDDGSGQPVYGDRAVRVYPRTQ